MDMIIGSIAALLTTISFLPQAIKTIRTADTKSLSLPMYLILVIGVALWILYGVRTDQPAVYVGNSITFVFAFTILVYKIKNSIKNEKTS